MQAVLSENTTQGSLRASEEIARHCTADCTAGCTADVLVGNYPGQNPNGLPTKTSAIRISSQALSHSRTKGQGRHHIDESLVQKAVRDAVVKTGLTKRATCHTFRHSFPTHLLQGGYDIRTVQELRGHNDVKTTMIHTHVLNRSPAGVRGDRLSSESLMPIRIRRHDNKRQETQVTDSEGMNADPSGGSTACYTVRKPNFRALCGSI